MQWRIFPPESTSSADSAYSVCRAPVCSNMHQHLYACYKFQTLLSTPLFGHTEILHIPVGMGYCSFTQVWWPEFPTRDKEVLNNLVLNVWHHSLFETCFENSEVCGSWPLKYSFIYFLMCVCVCVCVCVREREWVGVDACGCECVWMDVCVWVHLLQLWFNPCWYPHYVLNCC